MVYDVLNHLKAQGIISAIREPPAAVTPAQGAADAATTTYTYGMSKQS